MNELWMPTLVSSAACLAISVLAWEVLPFHAREHRRLSTEPDLLAALRRDLPPPGIYSFPYRGLKGLSTTRADVAASLARGPVGYVVIGKTGARSMALPIAQHFLFFTIVAALAAYIATISGLKDGAPFIKVFRIVATVSSAMFILGAAPLSIWFNRPWKSFALQCADGLACGLATGAVFGWLWPQ